MSTPEVVAFLFKLINFGVFIILVIYLFQRKVRSQVKIKIKEKEVFWQNLQTNKQSLIDQQHKLRLEITWQENYGNELLQKIALWKKESNQKEQELLQEVKINAQKAYERSKTLQEKKEKREFLQQVVPLVISDARKILEEKFSHEKNVEFYMTHVFKYMQKSSS